MLNTKTLNQTVTSQNTLKALGVISPGEWLGRKS